MRAQWRTPGASGSEVHRVQVDSCEVDSDGVDSGGATSVEVMNRSGRGGMSTGAGAVRILAATVFTLTLIVGAAAGALAQDRAPESTLFSLMQRWGNVEYEMQGDAQTRAFEGLEREVETLAETYPDDPRVLTAEGVVLASYARVEGGLGALGLAKTARDSLERAISLDPQGQDGSAYVTLGALYQRAPGWPIAFGDEDKARELLEKAVAIRPAGIDTNYYYAQFLEEQGAHGEAMAYAERALAGEAREGRASDEALRERVRAWIDAHR
ncbi:hypothetical protein [Salinicola avicenniae]|uniref:hypothetical protein n=1 Tax=Salinicola avicenniae TaxID=2916836 RepID=UPI0020742D22|nr:MULTISPECIES: hypothetical protein [unclassified Salinicola]